MYMDDKVNMRQTDMVVVAVCDGYDAIAKTPFLKWAEEKGFYNHQKLVDEGFLVEARDGQYRMKTMDELMDADVPKDKVPKNILHLFQVCTQDFGLE